MGYEDEFYSKKNIIGWTGDISGDAFTVYFADCDGNPPRTVRIANVDQIVVQFGHITQKHDCPYNIGREQVGECFSYAIFNGGENGTMIETKLGRRGIDKLRRGEKINDGDHSVLHPSRSSFNPVTKGSINTLAALIDDVKLQAIKTRYVDVAGFQAWLNE